MTISRKGAPSLTTVAASQSTFPLNDVRVRNRRSVAENLPQNDGKTTRRQNVARLREENVAIPPHRDDHIPDRHRDGRKQRDDLRRAIQALNERSPSKIV